MPRQDALLREHLKYELTRVEGYEFERFVRVLLERGIGRNEWPATEGMDGKIDFASNGILFQMYGSSRPHGDLSTLRQKIGHVEEMKTTATYHGLGSEEIRILTNITLTSRSASLKSEAANAGAILMDLEDAVTYLYPWYYPFDLLTNYHVHKAAAIAEEAWPYAIDERLFVDSFFYKCGTLIARTHVDGETRCVPYVKDQVQSTPVLCVGHYGMGKTTIVKFLFRHWDISGSGVYPVFLTINGASLADYLAERIDAEILRELLARPRETATTGEPTALDIRDEAVDIRNLARMRDASRLCLIFDGIDEATYEPSHLKDFATFLNRLRCPVILTCRLEFQPFFDVFRNHYRSSHCCVELLPWEQTQWRTYVAALRPLCPGRGADVDRLDGNLRKHAYGTLPSRPLFLKMLSDLEVNNTTNITISDQLKGNKAEVYSKFIQWKVLDDYVRKGGFALDEEIFRVEAFELLKRIAKAEYKKQQPETELWRAGSPERLAISHRSDADAGPGVPFGKILSVCSDLGFAVLNCDVVRHYLLRSSLFSTLRRVRGTNYTFSHRSFMEYLVAYQLAEDIFFEAVAGDDAPECVSSVEKRQLGSPEDATCSEGWGFYQTHEVSDLFQEEVRRIGIEYQLSADAQNEYFASAFGKVLAKLEPRSPYSEAIEEALYYAGKFGVRSPVIAKSLHDILANRLDYPLIYRRTASISLSILEAPSYCEDYVLSLIASALGDGEEFTLNRKIQIYYYGETRLHDVLRRYVDEYIASGSPGNVMALRLFTYFSTVRPDPTKDEALTRDLLAQVKEASLRNGHQRIGDICIGIEEILRRRLID